MATVSLPDRPSLDQLRKQARDLQRAVRAGDAQAAAHAAEHGFAAGLPSCHRACGGRPALRLRQLAASSATSRSSRS